MRKIDLERINEAPAKGVVLAYFRTEILFKKYESIDELSILLGDKEILELHAFDDEKEYRAIASTSKRWNGKIEQVIDFNQLDSFVVTSRVEQKYNEVSDSLKILNHLQYDESGNMYVDNYRLSIRR